MRNSNREEWLINMLRPPGTMNRCIEVKFGERVQRGALAPREFCRNHPRTVRLPKNRRAVALRYKLLETTENAQAEGLCHWCRNLPASGMRNYRRNSRRLRLKSRWMTLRKRRLRSRCQR